MLAKYSRDKAKPIDQDRQDTHRNLTKSGINATWKGHDENFLFFWIEREDNEEPK